MNFNSSRLVRLLSEAKLVDADVSKQDFAERVSQWVGAFDAVRLHDTLQSIKVACGDVNATALRGKTRLWEAELQSLRKLLVQSVVQSGAASVPAMQGDEADVSYAVYRKRYVDQQRQMEAKIGPFRAQVRQALDKGSPALRQLAALDAVMEQLLASREQGVLGRVPGFLEGHFKQLRQAHQSAVDAAGLTDDAALWRQPGGWLHAFGQALNEVLLAELDVRLQPVTGLIEAFNNEVNKST